MKEATGELNMTVIVIIAVAAIAAFFTVILFPQIKNTISNNWGTIDNKSNEQLDKVLIQ